MGRMKFPLALRAHLLNIHTASVFNQSGVHGKEPCIFIFLNGGGAVKPVYTDQSVRQIFTGYDHVRYL